MFLLVTSSVSVLLSSVLTSSVSLSARQCYCWTRLEEILPQDQKNEAVNALCLPILYATNSNSPIFFVHIGLGTMTMIVYYL